MTIEKEFAEATKKISSLQPFKEEVQPLLTVYGDYGVEEALAYKRRFSDLEYLEKFSKNLVLLPENSEILELISSEWQAERGPPPFIDELIRIATEHGALGISAIQVGLPFRVMLIADEILPNVGVSKYRVLINPKIIDCKGEFVKVTEGCLSFPGLWLKVMRAPEVQVEYKTLDDSGNFITKNETLEGLQAQCFQHEVDHLDGIVFTTLVSRLERDVAYRKRAKRSRHGR